MVTGDIFTWECEPRDHEIDFQGRVNNIYYLVYMEQARYLHSKSLGIDFRNMHNRIFDLVVVKTDIDFKAPIGGTDTVIVTSKFSPMGKVRCLSDQQIIRKSDNKVAAVAKHIIAHIDRVSGRPVAMSSELRLKFF